MKWNNTGIFLTITIVCESESWVLPYANLLNKKLNAENINCSIVQKYSDIKMGNATFFLGCTTICPTKFLNLNPFNFLVHESKLPKGRGFAPVSWSVLNNESELTFNLIEASEDVDSGRIYSQFTVPLRGNELCAELRQIQGDNTVKICFDFVLEGSLLKAKVQQGKPTHYPRRTPLDSELDVNKTISEQFNLLRIVDNERYPAFFKFKGRKFKLMIEDAGSVDDE